jgi:hypothetical protein
MFAPVPTKTSTRSLNLYWYPFPTAKKTGLSPPPSLSPILTYKLGTQKNDAQGWNKSYLMNLTRPVLNNPIPSTFCPIFAQLEHLCAKLLHQDCNDAHRWKGQPTNAHEKKRTFHTITNHQNNVEGTLHMSGTHLPIFAQSQQHNQEFSSPNIHPNWQKSKKTRGVGWEKLHKKLSPESNDLYLAYNMTLRVLYRPPPLHHPVFTLCAPLWRCTLCQEHNTTSKQLPTTKEGGKKFFFVHLPPVRSIFLIITDN